MNTKNKEEVFKLNNQAVGGFYFGGFR